MVNITIKIGNTIKMLRSKKHITQEQLATYLGVTPQAISRWEAENGYPDLETLPALADYFSITVDELLGYNQSERGKKKQDVLKEIKRLEEVGTDEEQLNFARQAVALYPSEMNYQINLANCLSREIWKYTPDNASLLEAESIYLTVIETCTDDEIKYDALSNLCTLYAKGLKNNKKAEETANRLPKMIYCREFTKSISLCDNNVVLYIQDEIDKLTDCLGTAIQNLVLNDNLPNDPSTWDKKIQMMETSTQLYRMIYGQDLMFYHARLAVNYWIISTYQMSQGKQEETILSLESMSHHAVAYDEAYKKDHGKHYSSTLVDHIVYPKTSKEFHELEEHTQCWYMFDHLKHERYNLIRNEERFKNIEKALQVYS